MADPRFVVGLQKSDIIDTKVILILQETSK